MWIAPGRVDVVELLTGVLAPKDIEDLNVLHGMFEPPGRGAQLAAQLWNIDDIKRAHDNFLAHWEAHPVHVDHPLAALIRLNADWSKLLRSDPGLPGTQLYSGWPADRSAAAFRRLLDGLRPSADIEIDSLASSTTPPTSSQASGEELRS